MTTIGTKISNNGKLLVKVEKDWEVSRKFSDAVTAIRKTSTNGGVVEINVELPSSRIGTHKKYIGGFEADRNQYVFIGEDKKEYIFTDIALALKQLANEIFFEAVTVKSVAARRLTTSSESKEKVQQSLWALESPKVQTFKIEMYGDKRPMFAVKRIDALGNVSYVNSLTSRKIDAFIWEIYTSPEIYANTIIEIPEVVAVLDFVKIFNNRPHLLKDLNVILTDKAEISVEEYAVSIEAQEIAIEAEIELSEVSKKELPIGDITVDNGAEAFELVAKYFPNGLEFDGLDYYHGTTHFCFCDEGLKMSLIVASDEADRRIEFLQIVNHNADSVKASFEERYPLAVRIEHKKKVQVDVPAIQAENTFETRLTENSAKVLPCEEVMNLGFLSAFKDKIVSVGKMWNSTEQEIKMSEIMELFSGKAYNEISDLGEITYFTCLKTLAESVGKMPVYLMDKDKNRITKHDTTYLLQVSPNSIQTPMQLFTYWEFCRNHYGNAYGYLKETAGGRYAEIVPLDPRRMQVWKESQSKSIIKRYYYRYNDPLTGEMKKFEAEEILHFKSWLLKENGIEGKSVREILSSSFSGVKASSKFLADLYQHGLLANAVVKFTGDLKRESQDLLLNEIEKQARDNNRRMITLPMGFDLQKLDLTLADSQFYELKKYSATQIAAAFGIQPFQLNDLEKSSYANAAMQNLQFYTSTLLYILSCYEQEMNRKLLKPEEIESGLGFKFNVAIILRGDIQQQADIIQRLVSCGVYSPNDARRWLDQPPIEGEAGNKYLVNGSMTPLEMAGAAYKGGYG